MSELGSGNGSSYPGGLDTDTILESSSTVARSDVPNDANAAIVAIETELGTDPAGSTANVKTFLQTEHNANGTHDNALVAMLAGAQTITGAKTFNTAPILAGAAWPSFSVHKNGTDQTAIVTATPTKITWATEEFDTNDDFDLTTERFTPSVAGKYLLTGNVEFILGVAGTAIIIFIYKNGVEYRRVQTRFVSTTTDDVTMSLVVDANGSTDYFELYARHDAGSDSVIEGDATTTWFTGSRIA